MKERPILFNAAMVRAIQAGAKTVTRRAITPQPPADYQWRGWIAESTQRKHVGLACWAAHGQPVLHGAVYARCPYGQVGDRLWVRETFMDLRGTGIEHRPTPDSPLQRYVYGADVKVGSFADETRKDYGLKWRPSIHMPRAACRLLLEITAVRVERLQAITEQSAQAEGLTPWRWSGDDGYSDDGETARDQFFDLWQRINGAGSWAANPWVWVVEFKRVDIETVSEVAA
ncbi:hypothetical protein AB9U01_25170 [Pseudomonas qingdaonensis]|uniref:hypothetical protein n=1 Tax=Pseudomonas qingdaonensis TaxID=2056231 RepID=UPI00351398CD